MFFIILVCIQTEVRKRLKNSFWNYLAFFSSLQMTERFKIIMLVLITFLLPVDLIDAGEKLLFIIISFFTFRLHKIYNDFCNIYNVMFFEFMLNIQ